MRNTKNRFPNVSLETLEQLADVLLPLIKSDESLAKMQVDSFYNFAANEINTRKDEIDAIKAGNI